MLTAAFQLDLPANADEQPVWYFNPLAWQLIFFTGFALRRGWIKVPLDSRLLLWGSVVVLLLGLGISLPSVFERVPPIDALRIWIADHTDKTNLDLLQYVHFLASGLCRGGDPQGPRADPAARRRSGPSCAAASRRCRSMSRARSLAQIGGMVFDHAGTGWAVQIVVNAVAFGGAVRGRLSSPPGPSARRGSARPCVPGAGAGRGAAHAGRRRRAGRSSSPAGRTMQQDARGLPVTATSDAAARLLDAAIAAYCGLRRDAGDRLKRALACDPGAVLGHVLKGYFMLLFATRAAVARAGMAAQAASVRDRGGAARRRASGCICRARALDRRRSRRARRRIVDAILAEYPRDLLALKLGAISARSITAIGGDARHDRGARSPLGTRRAPGYGYVLGCHAFALEECGDYAEAESSAGARSRSMPTISGPRTRSRISTRCRTARRTASPGSTAQEPHWGETNNFAFHVNWHRCLFLLALGPLR